MVSKIELFAGDLFKYVLHKNDLYTEGNLKLSESPPISEGSPFIEEIGKSVMLFSYVYRVMLKNRFFRSAFDILRSKRTFDAYVTSFCLRSTENSDFFTEFIVTLSFITEVAAYCFSVGCHTFSTMTTECFIKTFRRDMKRRFYLKGGWVTLRETAIRHAKSYDVLEVLIQTESPIHDIYPMLESAACLGLGEGFFSSKGVSVKEAAAPETKKKKRRKRKKGAKPEEAEAAPKLDELEVTENDVLLDNIMASVILKCESGRFTTNIPGTSRMENWPGYEEERKVSEASGACAIPEDVYVEHYVIGDEPEVVSETEHISEGEQELKEIEEHSEQSSAQPDQKPSDEKKSGTRNAGTKHYFGVKHKRKNRRFRRY